VSLDEHEMVPILPSKPQKPIAVAYDEENHHVYWTDVRQRTISSYSLFTNHTQIIRTIYLDHDGLLHDLTINLRRKLYMQCLCTGGHLVIPLTNVRTS